MLTIALLANNINTIVIVSDFIINQDVIATTLCIQKEEQKGCNGKCQLRQELIDSSTDKRSDDPLYNFERLHLDVFIVTSLEQYPKDHISIKDTRKNQADFRQKFPVSPFYDIDTPPPNLS